MLLEDYKLRRAGVFDDWKIYSIEFNSDFMVYTLESLSAQEVRLYEAAERVAESKYGSQDVIIQWLKETGVFSQYAVVHRNYLELFEQTDLSTVKLEALKRLIFLNWYVYSEPSIYTGLYELDESVIKRSYQWLDDYIKEDKLDQEFHWMLSYYSCWDWVILIYSEPGLTALTNFVKAVDTSVLHVPVHQLPKGTMNNRGQMGYYWISCSVEVSED